MADEYDIGKALEAIENELMASMIRNMKRHKAEEVKEDKQWSMWQAEQLKALEEYKRENQERYGKQFKSINSQLKALILQAKDEGEMQQEIAILNAIKNGFKTKRAAAGATAEFFKLNNRKLEALIKATMNDMQKAETAVLRMANDQYRKVIFNAQVYANSGAGTYEKAVDMATKDFLAAGLNCVEYANGARHTLSDYADMAIRTASKRAYLQGEGQKRQEWGIHTVIMNKRGNPCPLCLPFVGKVLIDDVWSGGPKDGKSKETGIKYPLMSSAIAAGLYHPRCKDGHTTYFEGISTPPDDKYTKEELNDLVEKNRREAQQQYAERQSDKFDRLSKYSLDDENQKKYAARREEWKKRHAEIAPSSGLMQNTEIKYKVFDKDSLREKIEFIRREKDKASEILKEVKAEEKVLTKKVYFDSTGTEEDMQRIKAISAEKKKMEEKLKELEQQMIEKQEIYKTEAEKRLISSGTIEEIKLSKKMTPETVDELEKTLVHLKDKYGIMPKGVVYNPIKVEDATCTYNWLDDKIYLSSKFNDSKDYLDNVLKSEKSLEEYNTCHNIKSTAREKIKQADKVITDKSVKGYEREKAVLAKADAEISIKTERMAVRENLMDVLTHEYGHFIHRHAEIDYVQKKNVFGAKQLGGSLRNDWVYDINKKYSREAKIRAAEISKYATDNPYETFAEGFLAIEKGQEIPEEIASVIKEAKRRAGVKMTVAKASDSGIIKKNGDTLKMDLQLFAENDIKKQESSSLKRAIRKFEKRIKEHEDYLQNPENHCTDWNEKMSCEREGLKRHWKKEIRNFNQSIQERIDELKERGDYDD